MPLALQLLGTVQGSWDDTPLKFATEYPRALLAYLAVEADVIHQRTTLATLLWPEENETTARHNLRQTLFLLKQTLAPVARRDEILRATPMTMQWQSQGVVCDLQAFQRLWDANQSHAHADGPLCERCVEHFTQAAALYQGEFLHSLLIKHSQPFEEWALLWREQCHRQALVMLSRLTAHHLAGGAYDQAQRDAARLVALEPWHEEGHRQLMQALAAQGQQNLALRQYESCRRILQQELKTPPSLETTQLYEQIRAGYFSPRSLAARQATVVNQPVQPLPPPPPPSPPPPSLPPPALVEPPKRLHNLPANLAPLVGRTQQVEQLRTLLHSPTERLLTIVGMGGMGKSRLALALLEQLVAEAPAPFPHGVWFVPLIGVAANVANLPDALSGATLKAVGMTAPMGEALQSALFHYLEQRHLLLVLDNVEQLLVEDQSATAVTEFVLALLQAAPGVTLLLTSRLPLQLLAETVIRLEGLPVPAAEAPAMDKRDAANYESVRLFVYHAQRTLPNFTLSNENLPFVIELCRFLNGMPLAIELAAALATHFTPSELLAAIRQNLDLLVSRRRDMDARHRHFSAVLESSWQWLSAQEQAILAQCSIFVGSFSRAAAQAVTGATVNELTSLVDKSLIQQPGVGVYQLHDLLRQFAAEQVAAAPAERAALAARHGEFYLTFVAAREYRLARHEPRQATAELRHELDNIRQAWRWAAVQADVPMLERATYGWLQFCLLTGMAVEGEQSFALAAAHVRARLAQSSEQEPLHQQTQHLLSKLLALHANYLFAQGKDEQMAEQAREAISLGAASGGMEGETFGYFVLGRALQELKQLTSSRAMWEKCIQLAHAYQARQPTSELLREVEYLGQIGLRGALLFFGEYLEAKACVLQAVATCQALGKVRGEVICLANLAETNFELGNYAAARQGLEQALAIARSLGYPFGEVMTQRRLGELLRIQGDYAQAQTHFEQAATTAYKSGIFYDEAYALAALIRLHCQLGNDEGAHTCHRQLQQRIIERELPQEYQAHALLAFAVHALFQQEYPQALAHAQQGWQLAEQFCHTTNRADAAVVLGHACAAVEQWTAAAQAYQQAIAICQQIGNTPLLVEPQAGLAQVALAQGQDAQALALVEEILPVLAEHPYSRVYTPFYAYLACYHVLATNLDQRASSLVHTAHTRLQESTARIHDEQLRSSFLAKVAVHRQLQQLHTATSTSPDR